MRPARRGRGQLGQPELRRVLLRQQHRDTARGEPLHDVMQGLCDPAPLSQGEDANAPYGGWVEAGGHYLPELPGAGDVASPAAGAGGTKRSRLLSASFSFGSAASAPR